MSKFKVGDRVRFIRGSTFPSNCPKGGMGTVKTVTVNGTVYVDSDSSDYDIGWMFFSNEAERDLELVTTKQGEKVMRKTYKLLKDMPGYKKGTLFQEQCDDGTQPYSPMSEYEGQTSTTKLEFRDRSKVEDNPKWFVEVFQVEPGFMTREELDEFEKFKAVRKRVFKGAKKLDPSTVRFNVYTIPKRRGPKPGSKRTPAQRRRMSAAQKARWAAKKAA